MRERGKSADAPESPEFFRTKCGAHSPIHQTPRQQPNTQETEACQSWPEW
jgi:hypothetical protein